MATATLSKIKNESEVLMSEQKREQETRRSILTLIVRYLQFSGYTNSAGTLVHEAGINLEKFDVADNIDLQIIVKEYQDYYQFKFGRPVKLLKRTEAVAAVPEERKNARNTSKSKAPPKPVKDGKKAEAPLELEGVAVGTAKEPEVESNEAFYENRLLKPMPEYPPDLRDLAMTIQREICTANPNVTFQDIVGLDEAKRLLKEAVLIPMKYPHLFTGLLEPWKGILLFGPPGTGKTMLAKAVATECRTTFFNISASSIVSKWRGDSEKLVRVLFDLAKYYQPSTIFIDEIDSIMSQREGGEHEGSRRMKTELLIQMDGLNRHHEHIFLLAASNLPWDLDIAMLRRLEKRIVVPLPSQQARIALLKTMIPVANTNGVEYATLAQRLEGYSGSDLKLLCKEAAMKPIRRLMVRLENMDVNLTKNWHRPADPKSLPPPDPVTAQDFAEALAATKPAGLPEEKYLQWFQEYGSA